jgi:hypothetical protein
MRDFSTRPRRRPPDALDAGLLAVAGLALIAATYATASAWTDLRRAREHVESARREASAEAGRLQALESRRGADSLAGAAVLTLDAPPPRVLAELAALLPPDVRLDSVSLSYGEDLALDVQVAARVSSAYDVFLQRLEDSPRFRDVLPGDESRDAGVRASIRATYRPGRAPVLLPAGGGAR